MYDLSTLLQFLVSGLSSGCIYGLIGIGFAVIFNASGIINFGQGAFVMLGGMLSYFFFTLLHLPLVVAILLAVLSTAAIGFVVELAVIQPLWRRRAPLFMLIIATLIVQVVLENGALLLIDSNPHTYPSFLSDKPLAMFGVNIAPQNFWIVGCSVALVFGLRFFYRRTIIGKAMRACAVNRDFAQVLGIPVGLMLAASFTISAALGAVAGALVTPIQYTAYSAALAYTVNGFIAAVIGGLGNPTGAFIGGILFGVVEAAVLVLVPSGYKEIVVYGVLLVVLIAKPAGFFGSLVEE